MDRQKWNERYAAQPVLWTVDPSPFLGGELGDRPPGRALDLGAGEGRTTVWLAERGWQVTAVDFSDVGLERGRLRVEALGLPGAVEWVCADLMDYDPAGIARERSTPDGPVGPAGAQRRPLPIGTKGPACAATQGYDLVLLMFVHLPPADRRRLLRQCAATLNPGGMVLIAGYHPVDVPTGETTGPPNRFTPDDIVADLDGLRIERAERLELPDAVDTVVRAVRD